MSIKESGSITVFLEPTIINKATMNDLFNVVEKVSGASWRSLFEQTRRLMGLLMKVPLISSASITREVGLAAVHFMRNVIRLYRRSGLCFTALYLKQCSVSLQRYYAGSYDPKAKLSVPVSLTRCGIPRLIPPVLRSHLRRRDSHGDMLVRLYLSWFGLAKMICVAPKITKATWSSLVTPHPDIDSVKEILGEIKTSFRVLQPLYLPYLRDIPLVKGMSWDPTWKSTPILDSFLRKEYGYSVDGTVDDCCRRNSRFQNIFVNLKHEIAAFIYKVNKIHSFIDGFFSPGILWYPRVLYPLDYTQNTWFANWDLTYFEKHVGPYFASLLGAYRGLPIASGRISQVIEGGGKRRLFAICNYVQQRLLFPVHKWAMSVLSRIPTDGTFNQERPLHRLKSKGLNILFSFDLKSATDRWPLSVMYTLQECIWGVHLHLPLSTAPWASTLSL